MARKKVEWAETAYLHIKRSFFENLPFPDHKVSRNEAYVDLYTLANFSTSYPKIRKVGYIVQRGQVPYGQRKLANRWEWSRGKVKRFLDELRVAGLITTAPAVPKQYHKIDENSTTRSEKTVPNRINSYPELINITELTLNTSGKPEDKKMNKPEEKEPKTSPDRLQPISEFNTSANKPKKEIQIRPLDETVSEATEAEDEFLPPIFLPTENGKYKVVDYQQKALQSQFSSVDVEMELYDLKRYLDKHPSERPTSARTPLFILEKLKELSNRRLRLVEKRAEA